MNEKAKEQLIFLTCNADLATPFRFYEHKNAPLCYPAASFLRHYIGVQLGADGIPEVVV